VIPGIGLGLCPKTRSLLDATFYNSARGGNETLLQPCARRANLIPRPYDPFVFDVYAFIGGAALYGDAFQ